jgi:hypothetical protein
LRFSALLLIGMVASGTGALPAYAFMPAHVDGAPASNIVQIGGRCGEHMHFVRTHRNKEGRLIRGHCARDMHR